MAENRVEILVTSRNDTKAGFDSARRDAENAGDAAGQGFANRFANKMMTALAGGGGAGEGGTTGAAGFFETFGSQFGMLAAGALVAAPAVAAVVTEVVGLASGLAAAGSGAGAFLLFAMPAFKQLQGDASSLVNLWDALQTAQNKLAVTQANYAADPSKANATALAAAQKGLLTAQNNLQAAQMGMGQDAGGAATAVLQLRTEYDKLSGALQNQAFQVLADGLQAVTKFLPALAPMATAFANALGPLLQQVGQFVQSKGFQDWLGKFDKIIGPATTAFGQGIGKVMGALGQLFTVMSSHDVVHAINIVFDAIAGIINGLASWIHGAMNNWDRFSGAVKDAWHNILQWNYDAAGKLTMIFSTIARIFTKDVPQWLDDMVGFFKKVPGLLAQALSGLPGILYSIGKDAIAGLLHGMESVPVVGGVLGIVGDLVGHAKSALGVHSPSTVFREIGHNVTEGFRLGLQDNAANLHLGGTITGGGGGPIVLQVNGGGSGLDALFFEWLKQGVMRRGGGGKNSVQVALGQAH